MSGALAIKASNEGPLGNQASLPRKRSLVASPKPGGRSANVSRVQVSPRSLATRAAAWVESVVICVRLANRSAPKQSFIFLINAVVDGNWVRKYCCRSGSSEEASTLFP